MGFAVAVCRTRLTAQILVVCRIEAVGRCTALLTERAANRRHFVDHALLHLDFDLDRLDVVILEFQKNSVDSRFGKSDGLMLDLALVQQKTLRSSEEFIWREHGGDHAAEVPPDGWTLAEVILYL